MSKFFVCNPSDIDDVKEDLRLLASYGSDLDKFRYINSRIYPPLPYRAVPQGVVIDFNAQRELDYYFSKPKNDRTKYINEAYDLDPIC